MEKKIRIFLAFISIFLVFPLFATATYVEPIDDCKLIVNKSDEGYDPVSPGDELIYHLTLENKGTTECTGTGVLLKDVFDPYTAYVDSSKNPATIDSTYLRWNFGTLNPGDKREVGLTMLVSNETPCNYTLVNKARFWSDQTDWGDYVYEYTEIECEQEGYCGDGILDAEEECDDGNNDGGDGCSATCDKEENCILMLTKSDEGYDPISPGEVIVYHLTLENVGATDCTGSGVLLKDIFDQYVSFINSSMVPEYMDSTYLRWNFGTLNPGDKREVGLTMLVSNETPCNYTLVNKARFWSDQTDWGDYVYEYTEIECEQEGYCGDGILDAEEECDDGNNDDRDGCNAQCKDEYCGDNVIQIILQEECELPNTDDNENCSQSTQTCSGNKTGTRDSFGNCDDVCGCVDDPFEYSCVLGICGATCDGDEDCEPSTCKETFTDYCNGTILMEYDSDRLLDSIIVSDSTDNTCDTEETCGCSDNPVSCEPPTLNQYCVLGVCGAVCDSDDDCDDGNDYTLDSCNDTSCGCEYERVPYCGDGILDAGEECDDGNRISNDGCSATCDNEAADILMVKTAGDAPDGSTLVVREGSIVEYTYNITNIGEVTLVDGVVTDDKLGFIGNIPVLVVGQFIVFKVNTSIDVNTTNTAEVIADSSVGKVNDSDDAIVEVTFCGDGVLQQAYGEECDDGNNDDRDGCNAQCKDEYCGDNILQLSLNETCELPNTFDNSYCSQSTQTCSGNKTGTRDDFGNCNGVCGCVDDPFEYSCVLGICGATCDGDEDCEPSTCKETFTDYCNGTILMEYDSDRLLDSINVSDSADNTCDTEETCGCSDNPVSCEPPTLNQYCVLGVCGATCDSDDDCDDGNEYTLDSCNDTSCGCEYERVPYCGDGILDAGEECDDGNRISNDGCSANCDNENPDVRIVKLAGDAPDGEVLLVLEGSNIEYSYNITNIGEVTLVDGVVTDDKLGFIGNIPVLVVGQSIILKKNATIDFNTTNIAEVIADSSVGKVNDSDDAIVEVFTEGCNPAVDVMFVIDRSGTMNLLEENNETRLENVKVFAKEFIGILNSSRDRVGLVSFAAIATLDQDLTSQCGFVNESINNLLVFDPPPQRTNIGEGLKKAQEEIATNGREDARHAIILLSDGVSNEMYDPPISCLSNPTEPTPCSEYAFNQSQLAKDNGTIIITIGIGVNNFTESRLILIATDETHYYFEPTNEELEILYNKMIEGICEEPQRQPSLTSFSAGSSALSQGSEKIDLDDVDSDGIIDDEDYIIGTYQDVDTNMEYIKIWLIPSDDPESVIKEPNNYEGLATVLFLDSNENSLLQFEYNFSDESRLYLNNITLWVNEIDVIGSMEIKGIDLEEKGTTKTIYINNLYGTDKVCIKDEENASVSVISPSCDEENEYILSCPGINGGYSCEIVNDAKQLKISGLKHSSIKQFTEETICGNGIIEEDEQCDGSNIGGLSCDDYGYGIGSLNCNKDCTISTSDCSYDKPESKSGGYAAPDSLNYHETEETIDETMIETNIYESSDECESLWECTEWNACVIGMQGRACKDINACETSKDKPDEKRICIDVFGKFKAYKEEGEKKLSNLITGSSIGPQERSAIILALFALILIVILSHSIYKKINENGR